jgi:hypothetical protein
LVFSEGAWHCFHSTGRPITGEDAGPGNQKAMTVLIGKIGFPDRKGRRCRRQEPHPFEDPGKASSGSRRSQEGWRILSDFADKFSFNHFANHL